MTNGRINLGPALLTRAEVAQKFRVDPKSVTRWAKEGRLSHLRTPGGQRRYSADEVAALLASTEQARCEP